VEKFHQRIEPVFLGADDEAAERIGVERLPRFFALPAPSGVGGLLGRRTFNRDE
jgi:hypothetical protein